MIRTIKCKQLRFLKTSNRALNSEHWTVHYIHHVLVTFFIKVLTSSDEPFLCLFRLVDLFAVASACVCGLRFFFRTLNGFFPLGFRFFLVCATEMSWPMLFLMLVIIFLECLGKALCSASFLAIAVLRSDGGSRCGTLDLRTNIGTPPRFLAWFRNSWS